MCGIFGLFNCNHFSQDQFDLLVEIFNKGNDRGPDSSYFSQLSQINSCLGFHRLAINGLNQGSDQPFFIKNKILICNGEIYNYKDLYKQYEITPSTQSDCEVIIHLYEKLGFEKMVQTLDGVFAFILIDYEDINDIKMYVARDPFGVRPLYKCEKIHYDIDDCDDNDVETKPQHKPFGFTSIMKQFNNNEYKMNQYKPGTWSRYSLHNNYWAFDSECKYFDHKDIPINNTITEKKALQDIYTSLCDAVKKRVETTDQPVACLLSGGLDSSLITSLVCKYYQNNNRKLETYSIGLKDSVDIKYARKVAEFLGTKHTEVIMTEKEFLDNIPKVIYNIESYDTTTVRASVGNYLIAKYINENSNAKVIFNGDGSDEVTGGYLYFHNSPDNYAFDYECKRLLDDICYFDVLRSDRSISSNGLEPRTPFLDKTFVTNYLSIPVNIRNHTTNKKCEKFLLRSAFAHKNLLPDDVLWRTKEAFSDGVSGIERSWFQIIQEAVSNNNFEMYPNIDINAQYTWNNPDTPEKRYYRGLFQFHYHNNQQSIPYFWMPKFIDASDASARVLSVYNIKNKQP